MRKVSKLLLIFLVFAGAFMSCEGEEEQFGWTPGENLIISGAAEANTLTTGTFFVEGYTTSEEYTWTVNGESVTPIDEGEAVSVFFDEPGDYTITVSNGTYTGTHVVTASSVTQEVAFNQDFTNTSTVEGNVLQIPVEISQRNPNTNTTVSFTLGGTAVEGEDYEILTPSPLEFFETDEDGELLATTGDTIRVRILNNNILRQPSRTLTINLDDVVTTGEGEYEVTLGETGQVAQITIEDDVRLVSIADAGEEVTLTAASEAGIYTFPVNISIPSEESVVVSYSVTGTGVEDNSGGTLTFAPGVTTQNLSITITDAAFAEEQEIEIELTGIESDDEEVIFEENEEDAEEDFANVVKVITIDLPDDEAEEGAGAGE